jgi:hypothetical protein
LEAILSEEVAATVPALLDQLRTQTAGDGSRFKVDASDAATCEDAACTNLAARGAFGVIRLGPARLRVVPVAAPGDEPKNDDEPVALILEQPVTYLAMSTGKSWYQGEFRYEPGSRSMREWLSDDGLALRQELREGKHVIARDIASHVYWTDVTFQGYLARRKP